MILGLGSDLIDITRVARSIERFGDRFINRCFTDVEKARAAHIRSSPLYWVTPDAAPTLCVHGTEDKYVHVEQAEMLVDKLKATGVETELIKLEGAGHGFKGKDAETAERAMIAFFDKHLKKK